VALILAVEDYANYRKLDGNVARANELAELLRARGFDVAVAANPANAGARAALRDLSGKVANSRLALVLILGHGASGSGQTFFLPNNATIERSTDLLSRGVSIGNVAQIVSSAKAAGVCFMMSAPNFTKPVEGVDMRPQFQGELGASVAVAVSNSTKIPVSRMDASAAQAIRDVISLLQSTPNADLKQLLSACAANQQGVIAGNVADISLVKPAPPKPQSPPPEAGKSAAPAPAPPPSPPAPGISEEALQALQTLEGMLDPRQVRRVQTKLTTLGHYRGPIDAIVGPLTREAIRDYQKKTGHQETGYLTPAELKALVEGVP